ncbi:hypothetical protein EH223_19045 [candidate division KSB1 bacterium]|nr:hypothetical protein [candidate division KSB1 bacterium]RQW00294.1 MAG: hypothetical protein EH223_19045 [candidate division KSB1 bacterium]
MGIDSTNTLDIYGVVIPTQWDRRGNIIQVAIQTDSFEKYLVGGDNDAEVMRRLDQTIHVRGVIIGEDVVGHKIITVQWIDNLTPTQMI